MRWDKNYARGSSWILAPLLIRKQKSNFELHNAQIRLLWKQQNNVTLLWSHEDFIDGCACCLIMASHPDSLWGTAKHWFSTSVWFEIEEHTYSLWTWWVTFSHLFCTLWDACVWGGGLGHFHRTIFPGWEYELGEYELGVCLQWSIWPPSFLCLCQWRGPGRQKSKCCHILQHRHSATAWANWQATDLCSPALSGPPLKWQAGTFPGQQISPGLQNNYFWVSCPLALSHLEGLWRFLDCGGTSLGIHRSFCYVWFLARSFHLFVMTAFGQA